MQVALGQVLHQLDEFLPFGKSVPLDDLLAVALLVFFGVRTLQVPHAFDHSSALCSSQGGGRHLNSELCLGDVITFAHSASLYASECWQPDTIFTSPTYPPSTTCLPIWFHVEVQARHSCVLGADPACGLRRRQAVLMKAPRRSAGRLQRMWKTWAGTVRVAECTCAQACKAPLHVSA